MPFLEAFLIFVGAPLLALAAVVVAATAVKSAVRTLRAPRVRFAPAAPVARPATVIPFAPRRQAAGQPSSDVARAA